MLQGAVALGGVTEPNGLALGSTIRGNATKQIDAVIARSLDSASMRTKLRPQVSRSGTRPRRNVRIFTESVGRDRGARRTKCYCHCVGRLSQTA